MDWKQCCAWAVGPGREQEHSLPDPHLCQCPSAVHCLRLPTQGPPANSDKATASEVGGSARSRPPTHTTTSCLEAVSFPLITLWVSAVYSPHSLCQSLTYSSQQGREVSGSRSDCCAKGMAGAPLGARGWGHTGDVPTDPHEHQILQEGGGPACDVSVPLCRRFLGMQIAIQTVPVW